MNTAGTGQLWVDGVKVAETTAAPVLGNSTFNMLIGANPGTAGDNFRTWPGVIDDVAIWNRPLSIAEVSQLFSSERSVAELVADGDNDFDGLPNSWEVTNGTLVDTPDADEDPDNDGRTNIQEFNDGTNPQVADADIDGLNDGKEFAAGTRPDLADTDGDGLSDGDEVNIHLTNPTLVDTDADGFSDSLEITYGTLPNDINSFPTLDKGLLGYWPLDDDLQDDTGNGGNRTYQDIAAGPPAFTAGKFGNGISLDHANNQYVIIDGEGGAPTLTDNGNHNDIMIDSNPDAVARSWNGIIDDVAIWERPLSNSEVTTIFSSTQSLGDQLGLGTPTVLTVTSIVPATNGSVDLTWTSRENANYSVFLTTDLSVPLLSWETAKENVASGGATTTTTTTTIPAIELNGLTKAFFVIREN